MLVLGNGKHKSLTNIFCYFLFLPLQVNNKIEIERGVVVIIGIRDFVDELKNRGELVEIDDEVDWSYEISAAESLSALIGGPALLFNNIKGTPQGNGRVLVGHFAACFRKPHRRVAMALGINPDLDRFGFFKEMWGRAQTTLKPVEVASGPCKEVIKFGKEVNLLEYPFLYHSIGDGSRYILLGNTIIREPDTGWLNSGNYCIAVHSRNRLILTPYAHTNFVFIYHTKYQARNETMPVAVAIGTDPAFSIASTMMLPLNKADLAGGYRGTPMELVRAETSDLLVPANAEMVIEGEVRPYERLPEGPKAESFGFVAGPRQPFYAMRVHCITQRANPIIPETHQTDGCSPFCLMDALYCIGGALNLRLMGFPAKAEFDNPGTTGVSAIYAMKRQAYHGFMRDVVDKITASARLSAASQSSLFVDDDVSTLEPTYFWEAMCTQVNPARDIIQSKERHTHMTIASSWIEEEDLARYYEIGHFVAPRLFIDATTKDEPPLGVRRTQFEYLIPDELQQWVVDNWGRLGFKEEARWEKGWIELKL